MKKKFIIFLRNSIGKLLRKIAIQDPEQILQDLAKNGAHIGKCVTIFNTDGVFIDDTRPWLLTIGDYSKITRGVVILTHDYSMSVLRRRYGSWIGEGRPTVIGNNVFIGMNSVILMGAHVGNNTIVGAGSVVSGKFPDDVVIAGNPEKVICSLDAYFEKRKRLTQNEAILTGKMFFETYERDPKPGDMRQFYPLFSPRDLSWMKQQGILLKATGDEEAELVDAFINSKPEWNSFDEFLSEMHKADL